MKIAVDIDGCCANLLDEAIKTWGKPRVPYSYSLEEMFPMVPEPEIIKWVENPLTYRCLEPVQYAKETLFSLAGSGWEITYLTFRPLDVQIETAIWLDANDFPDADVVCAEDKAKQLMNDPHDAVVEDSLKTALSLTEVCDNVYLIDWPYNRGACDDVIRVKGWKDILGDLCGKYSSGGSRLTRK